MPNLWVDEDAISCHVQWRTFRGGLSTTSKSRWGLSRGSTAESRWWRHKTRRRRRSSAIRRSSTEPRWRNHVEARWCLTRWTAWAHAWATRVEVAHRATEADTWCRWSSWKPWCCRWKVASTSKACRWHGWGMALSDVPGIESWRYAVTACRYNGHHGWCKAAGNT